MRNLNKADLITQAEPDGFYKDILKGRRVRASFETIKYYALMDACVRTKDSAPYNSNPILADVRTMEPPKIPKIQRRDKEEEESER